jgi:hypothetical protein
MSPEQVTAHPVDHRSDIFSFGSVLYEMLSGKRAFQRNSAVETMGAILKEDPPDLSGTTSSVPPTLERILRRCLEKDPEARFQSARDLGFALTTLSDALPSEVAAPAVRLKGGKRWSLVIGAGLALAAGAAAYSKWPRTALSPAPLAVMPFTSFPGQEVAPSFSPDGSQIAFAWSHDPRRGEGFDLYTKVIGGERPLRLTTHPANWISPAWSPDGRTIAFSRAAKDGTGIYLVPATGGPERKLIGLDQGSFDYGCRPAELVSGWDSGVPDTGRRLLDVDAHEKRRRTTRLGLPMDLVPAFSPDGKSLAVCVAWDVQRCFLPYPVARRPDRSPSGRKVSTVVDRGWERPLVRQGRRPLPRERGRRTTEGPHVRAGRFVARSFARRHPSGLHAGKHQHEHLAGPARRPDPARGATFDARCLDSG